MAGKNGKKKTTNILEKLQTGASEAAVGILNEFGIGDGQWGLDVKPQLERMLEWIDYGVPLFVRVFACLKMYTLCYLPGSVGVETRKSEDQNNLVFDEARFAQCKRHGALLAVTETRKGKLVPIGPNHLRNRLNEAAVRAFTKQESRDPTAEELERLQETPANIRRAIAFLECIGMCLRTDTEDVPLTQLRDTAAGRLKAKQLSGENKIRIYVYLRPKPTMVYQGRHQCLPSEEEGENLKHLYKRFLNLKLEKNVLNRLKPLYRAVIDLGLDIEPQAFVGDADLQGLVADQVASGEAQRTRWEDDFRRAILAKYPSAAPQSSTALNATGKEHASTSANAPDRRAVGPNSAALNPNGKERVIPELPIATAATSSPDRRAAEPHNPAQEGRQAGTSASPERDRASHPAPPPEQKLVSQPRAVNGKNGDAASGRPKTTEDMAAVDAAMRMVCSPATADVKRLFSACREKAADCTPEEVAEWARRVIQKAGKGIASWEKYLFKAVPEHFEAPGFQAWRAEQRAFSEQEAKAAKPLLSAETLRAHLESSAAAVPYPEISAALRHLAAEIDPKNLEPLEERLAILEEKMIAAAHADLNKEQVQELRQQLDGELKPYRGKMTATQLSAMEKAYLERTLLEKRKLPRLSLFCIDSRAIAGVA
jgi:hypothetical protein